MTGAPAAVGFIDALGPAQADDLRARGRVRTYQKGAALFHERQGSDRVFVLLRGQVKLSCTTEEGKEVLLAIRGPGELLGELGAIDGEPRSATATAIEPVDALVLSTADFVAFLERDGQAATLVLRMLARRLRDADRKRIEFAAQDSVGRVAARVVELADRFGERSGEGIKVALPISQDELAGWTGSSREAVSKALRALRELGWIETGRRTITVRDIDSLRERAAASW